MAAYRRLIPAPTATALGAPNGNPHQVCHLAWLRTIVLVTGSRAVASVTGLGFYTAKWTRVPGSIPGQSVAKNAAANGAGGGRRSLALALAELVPDITTGASADQRSATGKR